MAIHESGSDLPVTEAGGPSPFRWVVVAHVMFLLAASQLARLFPLGGVERVLVIGVVASQVALALIWLTLIRAPSSGAPSKDGVLLLLILLLTCVVPLSLLLALPFVFAQGKGMRLKRVLPGSLPPSRPMQFSMRMLVCVTVVVAMLFALGQFGLASRQEEFAANIGELGNLAVGVAGATVAITCATIVMTVPVACVWAVLSPGRVLPRMVLIGVGWLLGALLIFQFFVSKRTQLGVAAAVAVVAVIVLTATLGVMRALRYRVVWEVESPRSTPNW